MTKLVLLPRVSEKAYGLSKDDDTYVFDVSGESSNKTTIAKQVEDEFGVTVTKVNVMNVKGKAKRMINRRGRATPGKRNDVKRAYVTVKSGDYIPVFAAIDEAEEKAKKAQQVATRKAKK